MYRAILLEPEYPGNIGFIARLSDNFGIDEYCLVNPACEVDETARTRASHAQDTLRTARTVPLLDAVADDLDCLIGTTGITVDEDNVHRHAMTPRRMRDQIDPGARTGVLFGRESTGLTNTELDRCDFVVSIPTQESYQVMNISHAAAIMFYELAAARDKLLRESASPVSSRAEREVLDNLFKTTLEDLDWEELRTEKTVRAFRNVIGRSYVTGKELQLLLGVFDALHED